MPIDRSQNRPYNEMRSGRGGGLCLLRHCEETARSVIASLLVEIAAAACGSLAMTAGQQAWQSGAEPP